MATHSFCRLVSELNDEGMVPVNPVVFWPRYKSTMLERLPKEGGIVPPKLFEARLLQIVMIFSYGCGLTWT